MCWVFGKPGGAYVPIDPNYPQDRIQYMLEESRAKLLLAHRELVEHISFTSEVIYLDDPSIELEKKTNLVSLTKPENLAYVMFTSGTTGQPKGL